MVTASTAKTPSEARDELVAIYIRHEATCRAASVRRGSVKSQTWELGRADCYADAIRFLRGIEYQ